MDRPQIEEVMDETRELFERILSAIKDDFDSYINASVESSDKDLQFYAALSEKEKVFNIAAAIMARTASMYDIELIKWLEELLFHNTGIIHKLEVFQALPIEIER